MKTVLLFLLCPLIACCLWGGSACAQEPENHFLELMTTLGHDSLYSETWRKAADVEDSTRVSWVARGRQGRVMRWTSRTYKFNSRPQAVLMYINSDSLPDLFLTYWYEGTREADILQSNPDSVFLAHSSRPDMCALPELVDVTGDGRIDVLEHRPGLLTAEQCGSDFELGQCGNLKPIDWIEVWVQTESGFVSQDKTARTFYRELAREYDSASADARRIVSQGGACGSLPVKAFPKRLASLARRARSVAAGVASSK